MKRQPDLFNNYIAFHNFNVYFPTRTIYFGGNTHEKDDDVVTSSTVSEVIKNLHILECEKIAPISIILNTVGGSWDDGIAVYDLIKSLKSPVIIIGMGKVYSMGTVILQAGYKRILTKNTSLLCHDGSDGYRGETKNFENWAEHSKKIRMIMYNIYYERMKEKNNKIKLNQIEDMCNHDFIINAEEAIELGLADEIMENIKK